MAKMMESKNFKSFVKLFLYIIFPLIILTALFNFLVDPLTIHQVPQIPHFNQFKTNLDFHDRLYKAIEIGRKKPQSIVLGSSRVLSMSPADIESKTGIQTFNVGLRSASFDEMYHYFNHAVYHQPDLKYVIIGLDFCGFNYYIGTKNDFSFDRLQTDPIIWRDYLASLFSFGALKSSYQTFKANFWTSSLPLKENEIITKGDLSYLKFTLSSDYKSYRNDEKKIEMFRKLVDKCREKSIDLKVFISPAQAIYWESIYRSGLWPSFEELKRKLSSIYPIWDFSGFNSVTTQTYEKIIQEPLYHECSHFCSIVGKIILGKMFEEEQEPSDFGILLTNENIENSLQEMRNQLSEWLQTHEDILEKIRNSKDW